MSRSWLKVLLALAISFVYEKSGSAGPETPAEKAWPVIEPTIKDLVYAEKSPEEKLDLYLPAKGSGSAPVVIWIHGGGFIEGDKGPMPRRHFGSPPPPRDIHGISQIQVPNVAALVVKGYAVVSLNYRLGTSFVNGARPATQVTRPVRQLSGCSVSCRSPDGANGRQFKINAGKCELV